MEEPRPRIPPSLAPHAAPDGRVATDAWPDRELLHRRRSPWQRIRRALLWMFLVLVLLALVPPGLVLAMRWWDPPTTAFMLRSPVQPVSYQWVPRDRIPEALRKAVVAAEDQKFWTHWGFDFIAIAEAMEHNEKSQRKRGASTITQQTAKNVFLWPSRSWLRKGLEVSFTLLLEGLWPKQRILEVYLNVAEFGPGVYGAEAAAQKFFGKPAAQMSAAECAQLAAVLPNPRRWRADRPGPYVQSRVDWILGHLGEPRRFSTFPAAGADEPVEPVEPGLDLPDEEAAAGAPVPTDSEPQIETAPPGPVGEPSPQAEAETGTAAPEEPQPDEATEGPAATEPSAEPDTDSPGPEETPRY